MASLGEFDAAVREINDTGERDTFRFGGSEFTVVGNIPAMLMLQLGAAAGSGVEDVEGMAAIWEALRRSLTKSAHTDENGKDIPADDVEFQRFFKLALDRESQLDELMKLTFKLFEAQSGRPTEQAPDSSAGPSSTSPSSSASSTHPGLAHLRPVSEVLTG
jgi:hypothetical protein